MAALTVAADQAAKMAVRQSLPLCTAPRISACDHATFAIPVTFVHAQNTGSFYGFSQGLSLWIVLAAAGCVLVPLYARALRRSGWLGSAAVGLQAGGALANLVDRLSLGAVTDFIHLGAGPVFNPADVALLLGMLLAVAALARSRAGLPANGGPQDRPQPAAS